MRFQHRTVWIIEMLVEGRFGSRYEATVGCALTRDRAKEVIKVWRANCPNDKFKIAKYRKEGR